MIGAAFHLAAFVALTIGLVLSAALFAALAIVLTGGGGRRRQRRAARPARILARTPHFDLAIDR